MTDMMIEREPYWIKKDGIKKVEDLKNATFMGFWCTKRFDGSWNEVPVDVFYVANPDRSQGHSNYFGLHYRDNTLLISDAQSAFSQPILGLLCDSGRVLVSRYRHDYRQEGSIMVDGGRDYFKCSAGQVVEVTVNGSEFTFNLV